MDSTASAAWRDHCFASAYGYKYQRLDDKVLEPLADRFLQNLLNVRDAENGYQLVGREEAATQARAVQVCKVHRQVRAVVATADQDVIRMLQAFLIAMQATRALSADDGQDDGSDGPSSLDGILATMMQVFGYIAAFVETYPAAVSAAAQVVAICIILCLASCFPSR